MTTEGVKGETTSISAASHFLFIFLLHRPEHYNQHKTPSISPHHQGEKKTNTAEMTAESPRLELPIVPRGRRVEEDPDLQGGCAGGQRIETAARETNQCKHFRSLSPSGQ